jgi:simple sugar transport system permease protein
MTELLAGAWDVVSSPTMYESAFRLGAFLAFAAVGELIAERAGTLNISVEAMLVGGAFASAVGFHYTESFVVGVVAGIVVGVFIASIHANLSHRLTADQFVVGLTLNVLMLGVVAFLDSAIKPVTRLAGVVEIPVLSQIPLVGRALFAQRWPAYLIYLIVPTAWWLLYRTRFGLEVRAVGEDPQAADVSGIHVNRRRRQTILIAGFTSGLGGAFLVLGQVGSFEPSAVGGRGFIAIAAVIFGGWTLRGALFGCFLFGFVDASRLVLPILGRNINTNLAQALPFLVTLAVMLVFAHRTRQPRALAQPFIRGLK